jgi:hypothetical protein
MVFLLLARGYCALVMIGAALAAWRGIAQGASASAAGANGAPKTGGLLKKGPFSGSKSERLSNTGPHAA